MAFNPALPQTNSPQSSAEMRGQLTGLKDLIDALPASSAMADAIINQTAGTLSGVSALGLNVSNPPTQAQVQAIANRLDLLINALKAV
jgi:hypothetical protein